MSDYSKRKRKTTLVRVYSDTKNEIDTRFPGVRSADFIDMVIRTNPAIQLEAFIRGKKASDKNKKK